jgi:glycosyltransferase involved in cell wall biosynthesis
MNKSICHLTTVHPADDVNIFYKACMSLVQKTNYNVILCAPGSIPENSGVIHHKLTNPSNFRLVRFIKSQVIALKIIMKIRADIWHIHDPELLPTAILLIFLRRKVVWDSHEDYYRQFDSKSYYRNYVPRIIRPFLKLLVYWLLNFVDRSANGVICATEAISKRYTNRNIAIVGNQVDLKEFASCYPLFSNKNVLYTGQPGPNQCFKQVVDAISQIPNLKLVVACRSIGSSELAYAQKILGNNFDYLGWLSRRDLISAISNSIAGLVTYDGSVNHLDNEPNKFFEFCAGGLPILATPTVSNKKLIGKSRSGILARGYSSNSIKSALSELISSEKNWINYSSSAKNWVQEHGTWSKSESALLDLYRKILQ